MEYIKYPHAVIHNGKFYPAYTPIEVIEVTAKEIKEAPIKPNAKNTRKKGVAKDDK